MRERYLWHVPKANWVTTFFASGGSEFKKMTKNKGEQKMTQTELKRLAKAAVKASGLDLKIQDWGHPQGKNLPAIGVGGYYIWQHRKRKTLKSKKEDAQEVWFESGFIIKQVIPKFCTRYDSPSLALMVTMMGHLLVRVAPDDMKRCMLLIRKVEKVLDMSGWWEKECRNLHVSLKRFKVLIRKVTRRLLRFKKDCRHVRDRRPELKGVGVRSSFENACPALPLTDQTGPDLTVFQGRFATP